MNPRISTLILLLCALNAKAFLFGGGETWDDLKVTWGLNPFTSYNSMPRTVEDAVNNGWTLVRDCSKGIGNRYTLNGDQAVILIFDVRGMIAGIASGLPKGLPFSFPSSGHQDFFVDEGDSWTINAYFTEPNSICSKLTTKQSTGDRLIIKGNKKSLNIPIEQSQVEAEGYFTKGGCFVTMGRHFWATTNGTPLDANTPGDSFLPLFLLYNSGKLNGFGFAFNADLPSGRYEHPPIAALSSFFMSTPTFLSDPNQAGTLSTLHIYLDSTPLLNYC